MKMVNRCSCLLMLCVDSPVRYDCTSIPIYNVYVDPDTQQYWNHVQLTRYLCEFVIVYWWIQYKNCILICESAYRTRKFTVPLYWLILLDRGCYGTLRKKVFVTLGQPEPTYIKTLNKYYLWGACIVPTYFILILAQLPNKVEILQFWALLTGG